MNVAGGCSTSLHVAGDPNDVVVTLPPLNEMPDGFASTADFAGSVKVCYSCNRTDVGRSTSQLPSSFAGKVSLAQIS